MEYLGYVLSISVFLIYTCKVEAQTIPLTAALGESVSFSVPHSKDCHNYILYDPRNISVLIVNKYGNNLQNWASDRAIFSDHGDYITFTIRSVQEQDQGHFRFVSAWGDSDPDCRCTFHLLVTQRVDGAWTEWSDFGTCSETCGTGVQLRTRSCTNPAPQYGGNYCSGSNSEERACRINPCPVDGAWTEWSNSGACSETCGTGVQLRTRSCTNPAPQYGGNDCSGSNREERVCRKNPCPVDGAWTEWSNSGTCSNTCGTGVQLRTRSCTNPAPQYGGNFCSGSNREERTCRKNPCPVHGNWGEWSVFTECSVTCGTGIHTRWRECSNPVPAHGGNNCMGKSTERNACTEHPCPVDGGWSQWSEYGRCSVNCNTGVKVRTRTCSNPTPMHGGRDCVGSANESAVCNSHHCRVDGGWSHWSEYGECSVSCNTGTKVRTRTCTEPVTAYGGRECVGRSTESVVCNDYLCPINGGWSEWSEEPCSVSCGGGSQNRYRVCNNPEPALGGKNCTGRNFDIRDCNENLCQIDGSWSSWSNYSECSETCGSGIRSRKRTCSEPRPQNGGKMCEGDNKQSQLCKEIECEGPPSSPMSSSQETPTVVFIGGGVAALVVVIVIVVAVATVCYKKHKQRNTSRENRNNAGSEMRNMMPSQVDNPTYAEPEEEESGVYWEIPSRTSCYPPTCESQYEELPEACSANENENPYAKMDPNLGEMKKVHEQGASCRGSDYLTPENINRINTNEKVHKKANENATRKMSPRLTKLTNVHMQDSFGKASDFLESETQKQTDANKRANENTYTNANTHLKERNKVHEQEEFCGGSDYLTPQVGNIVNVNEPWKDNGDGYVTPTFVPRANVASHNPHTIQLNRAFSRSDSCNSDYIMPVKAKKMLSDKLT